MKPENILKKMSEAGKQAALAHPKVKLWAKVNHVDNFALAVFPTVYDAMMDVVIKQLDNDDSDCVTWFNKFSNVDFHKLVLTTGMEVYTLLK